jgi:hypothetical protein
MTFHEIDPEEAPAREKLTTRLCAFGESGSGRTIRDPGAEQATMQAHTPTALLALPSGTGFSRCQVRRGTRRALSTPLTRVAGPFLLLGSR